MANEEWYAPFDPEAGANFEKNVGYIEGNAWQYVYMIPHDIPGMIKLKGGEEEFVDQLDFVFDQGHFDMANEPDFAYPYLYNFTSGARHKTQERIDELLENYYTNSPGNTG